MTLFGQGVQENGLSDVAAAARGNAEFALDLYHTLRKEEGNLFFSPYSISTALAMTYAGARANTETQIAQALHFTLGQRQLHPAFASLESKLKSVREKGPILLNVANALWPQDGYPFLEEFLALMRTHYGVLITPVDYNDPETARQKINAWVEEKTQKIRNLISPGVLDALTRLVLTNAIYFKGNWAHQFEKESTQNAPFWVSPGDKVEVPLMTKEGSSRYAESDGLQILELTYAGDNLAMIVLLPKQVDELEKLEAALTFSNIKKWSANLHAASVRVFLPRFKINRGFRLNHALASMGMPEAFDRDKANFSGMDGNENWFYISDVLHKAFVDVNEEGTEAAAATAVAMKARGPSLPLTTFRADHPFIFLILERNTGSILFLGRVLNPVYETA